MQIKKSFIITLLLLAILTPLTPALAGPNDPPVTVVKLINPLGGSKENPKGQTDMRVLMGNIIQGAMGIVGSLVLAVFVYGGFLWLTSAGKAEQVKKGTDTMMWAAIGLFLIFGAYAILGLVLEAIGAKGVAAPATPITAEVPAAEKEYQCNCVITDAEGNPQSSVKEAINKDDCEKDNKTGPGKNKIDCKWVEK